MVGFPAAAGAAVVCALALNATIAKATTNICTLDEAMMQNYAGWTLIQSRS